MKDDDNISEADPNDIAHFLKDTDDLDGNLFKSIKSSNNIPAGGTEKKSSTATKGAKTVMFNDDPLDDIDRIVGNNGYFDTLTSTKSNSPIKYQSSFSLDERATSNKPKTTALSTNGATKGNECEIYFLLLLFSFFLYCLLIQFH